ncbi:MAG: M3 family metallopeptidase [Lawsonella sp.]
MTSSKHSAQSDAVQQGENPLLVESTLPYGLPDFAVITDDHVWPAFTEALKQHTAEVAAIAVNSAAPTAENTVVALEKAGQDLARVLGYFYTVSSADATDKRLELENKISPRLSSHNDDIYMNPELFQRIRTVFNDLEEGLVQLDEETARLVRRYYDIFVRRGAGLDPETQQRVRELNTTLSELQTKFGDVLLKDTQARSVHLTDEDDLAGVDKATREFFAKTARDAGKDGWMIPLGLPTVQPVLEQLEKPEIRQRVYAASLGRGGAENQEIARRMALLRAEKAQLMGYVTHAHFVIADETAETPQNAKQLLLDLAPAAVRNAEEERKQLTAAAAADGVADFTAADWPYYANQVQKTHYSLDQEELKKYFRLTDVVQKGVFYAAETFYNLRIEPREDLVGFTPDTQVWEVTDLASGAGIGLLLTDNYTRPTKRGGAWMNSIIDQNHLLGQQPIVINVLNLNPPAAGEEVYLTLDEVETLFHEFGHALHGLLSAVQYPLFSGTNVPRDFVEFPSQFNEMWALHPDTITHYAKDDHGNVIPSELVEKIKAAQKFGQGFSTVEYLAASIIDLAWHYVTVEDLQKLGDNFSIPDFENQALADAGLLVDNIAPRYRTSYYQHIFAGGYSAGYYSYIWAEVLDADTVEWVNEQGGLNPAAGARLRDMILARGGSINYMDAYQEFRGRKKDITPLLERRGLV